MVSRRQLVLLVLVALCHCSTHAESAGDVVAVDVDAAGKTTAGDSTYKLTCVPALCLRERVPTQRIYFRCFIVYHVIH